MPRTSAAKFRDEKRRITAWLWWWWKAGPRAHELRTAVQLAHALGITKSRVTQVFEDENPGIDLLLAIWRATGYPLEVLASKDPPPVPDAASPSPVALTERLHRAARERAHAGARTRDRRAT